MSEFDSDIEFDFFEDLETREEPPPQDRRAGRPPGGPPGRQPTRGPALTPTLRLIGLIAFAILVIVLLVFWIQSCQGAGKKKSYSTYMEKVTAIAKSSERIGRQLTIALTTPGIKSNELATKIDGLAQQQQQDLVGADELSVPGPLREEDASLQESLGFRVDGLRGLADTFRRTAGSKDTSGAALQLANRAQRLVSSDVVWIDLFRTPSITELRSQGITGIAVPSSAFVINPDFGSPSYWTPVVQRLLGAQTGGGSSGGSGLHGTGIVGTKALPSGQALSTSAETTVTAGTDLGFAVTVKDTGDAQEVQVKVTLTIAQQPSPIVATQTIDVINSGEEKTVTFKSLGQVQFATKTIVKVDVQPVPNEAHKENNSAEYPVIFSLG